MSNALKRLRACAVYGGAEPAMLLSVFGGSMGPGVIPFSVARETSQGAELELSDRLATVQSNQADDEADLHALETTVAALSARLAALEAVPALRAEKITGTATTITFAKPFATPPIMIADPSWQGQQIVMGTAVSITKTGAVCVVKRSRGTLLLTAGPFEDAPANTSYTMIAIGA